MATQMRKAVHIVLGAYLSTQARLSKGFWWLCHRGRRVLAKSGHRFQRVVEHPYQLWIEAPIRDVLDELNPLISGQMARAVIAGCVIASNTSAMATIRPNRGMSNLSSLSG